MQHPQSHKAKQAPPSPNIICSRAGQRLLSCRSAIAANSKQDPFITQLARVHQHSQYHMVPKQPHRLLLEMLERCRSASLLFPLNMFGSHNVLWPCILSHVAEIKRALQMQLLRFWSCRLVSYKMKAAPLQKVICYLNKVGAQERNALSLNFILRLEIADFLPDFLLNALRF